MQWLYYTVNNQKHVQSITFQKNKTCKNIEAQICSKVTSHLGSNFIKAHFWPMFHIYTPALKTSVNLWTLAWNLVKDSFFTLRKTTATKELFNPFVHNAPLKDPLKRALGTNVLRTKDINRFKVILVYQILVSHFFGRILLIGIFFFSVQGCYDLWYFKIVLTILY